MTLALDTIKSVAWLPAGIDACAMYRMFMPHLYVPNSVFQFSPKALNIEGFKHCKTVVVQRLCTEQNLKAIQMMRARGMKVIYDLDDDMWHVPSFNPAHKLFRSMLEGFSTCASQCDVVTVSTYPLKLSAGKELARRSLARIPEIIVIPNSIDFTWFKSLPFRIRPMETVTVGWAGTNTHTGDVERVFSLLPALLRDLPNMRLELAGLKMEDASILSSGRFKQRDFVPISEYPSRWASWQWDITLAPLEDNTFNRSKSNIKQLEAAAINAPCLVSPTAAYKDFVYGCQDREAQDLLSRYTLCKSPGEWKRNLTALIQDPSVRAAVGQAMRVSAERFNIQTGVKLWLDLFASL